MKQEKMCKMIEEQILNSYEDMYRLAFAYVHNEEDAKDIVQESVYKAIKNASKIEEASYIKTWIWRIVINTAVDFIRRNKKVISIEEIFDSGKEDVYRDFDTINALNVLDEKEKAVIILRFFEDKKISDVAEILHENISTVKTILYRSLRKLKIELMEGEMMYEG